MTRTEKTPTHNPEMIVTGVVVEEDRRGIPIVGWDGVKRALYLFADGGSRGSGSTQEHDSNASDKLGGSMAVALFNSFLDRIPASKFVDNMLLRASSTIQSRGLWWHDYDFDGAGSFYKTAVGISLLPELEGGYLLELNASYAGRKVEDGLAEALGVEQGIYQESVTVSFASNGDQLTIDLNWVLKKLGKVRGFLGAIRSRNDGQALASYLAQERERGYEDQIKPFILGTKNGIEVLLRLGGVGNQYEYTDSGRSVNHYHSDGPILTTPLDRDYEDESKFVPPSLVIEIRREVERRRLPIIDSRQKELARRLAVSVRDSFR